MGGLGSILAKLGAFLASAVVGALVVTVAMGVLADRSPVSTASEAPDTVLAGADTPAGPGPVVAFNTEQSGDSAPLPSADPVDLNAAAAALLVGGAAGDTGGPVNPTGFPRITPITQFDGSPFENANCTLTSGAMLARLTFGIVTTGGTLRTLQDDQDGGTGLNDLSTALFRGYGVSMDYGLIRPAQLKQLLAAGYGAVIQGMYGALPSSLRLSKDFTDGHAIYLDGYYPGDAKAGIPEAYYVIDPIGRPFSGYEGDWWPASAVDDFARAFSGTDRIAAMWGFPPGGTPPDVVGPDVLPIPPDPSPGSTPAPTPTPAPGETPGPITPVVPEPGDLTVSPPVAPPDVPIVGPRLGGIILQPVFDFCLITPTPAGCPTGIEAVFDLPLPPIIAFPLGPKVTVVAVDSPQANVALVWFTVDGDQGAPADVQFWHQGGGAVQRATKVVAATAFGKPVLVARLDVDAATAYEFRAVAGNGVFAGYSAVGTFTTGSGVEQFSVELGRADAPVIKTKVSLSPYVRQAEGGFARPLLSLAEAGDCTTSVSIGTRQLCLEPARLKEPVSCSIASVTWKLAGIPADEVVIRAFPAQPGVLPDGTQTLSGVIEAGGAAPAGSVDVGCLSSGVTYTIALDAVGDAGGYLASRTVTVP